MTLFAIPFTVVGSVFAAWPPMRLYKTAQRARIEVSGRSLLLERTLEALRSGTAATEV